MRVAFDCSGTLLSRDPKILKLWKWFESKGCEMVVWSNSYSYCEKADELHGLKAKLQLKQSRSDLSTCVDPEEYYMDIAVDDDSSQTHLAAKKFIWVHEIPEDESEFEAKYGSML